MKIRLAVSLTLERRRDAPPAEEQFEHRDNDGTLAELRPAPVLGFRPPEGWPAE